MLGCGAVAFTVPSNNPPRTPACTHVLFAPNAALTPYCSYRHCLLCFCVLGCLGTEAGHTFLKLDSGMTEILRPSLYGAQHPLAVIPTTTKAAITSPSAPAATQPYVVVGHCCESGDILTPAPYDPEGILERVLPTTSIGDILMVGGAGAYCSSMATKHYNSFPEAAEVMVASDGGLHLIRRRQPLAQLWQNEVVLPGYTVSAGAPGTSKL